jgi:metallo-beta-lactamase family protein
MRLRFHGACRAVTGSCFLLEAGPAKVLIDCGMVQGSKTEKELNYRPFPFRPGDIDAVVLSHSHIDHSGLLPKLVKDGFEGPIFATRGAIDLCSIMLPDSGHIQEMEVEQLNRRNAARGKASVEPIYTAEQAETCLTQFRPARLGEWFDVAEGVRVRLWSAGHLLGSASIELEATEPGGAAVRVLFSGDIGPASKLFERDPEGPEGVDHVVCETTYGDVERPAVAIHARRRLLLEEVRAASRRNGALIIPSFAVERAQELLTDLVGLMESGDIPQCPLFIDSPLASRASRIFAAHASEIEMGDALVRAMNSPAVRFTESTEQSKAIGKISGFHIVISASGMCEAGRIRHHLRNWLWRSEGTVLLVGFQAQGTLGRILQDGASRVRIMGEEIQVRARIRSLDLYSGHADGPELARWINRRKPISGSVFLVHGEQAAMDAFAARLATNLAAGSIVMPELDQFFELDRKTVRPVTSTTPARIASDRPGHLDWHNDLSRLILDIDEAVRSAADERARQVVIRNLRRALGQDGRGR